MLDPRHLKVAGIALFYEEWTFMHIANRKIHKFTNSQIHIMRGGRLGPSGEIVPYQNTHLSNDTFALNLHRWNICANAYEKGRR